MTDTATDQPKPRSPTVWTKEQSRIMAARSVAVRKAKREQAKTQPIPQEPLPPLPEAEPLPEQDGFVSRTLLRVRKQMARIDRMLMDEIDPAKLDRLAAAFGRLAEIERQLADRPLPGSRRPAPEPTQQSRGASLLNRPKPQGPVQGTPQE